MTAIALTVAGSDSGGGAGIQADLKTFSALGVYGASVVTALTAQNTRGVQGVLPVPPDFVAAQIDSVLGDLRVGAVKIGMVPGAQVAMAVVDALGRHPARPVVLDPVMVATSGDRLVDAAAMTAIRDRLLPRADLITPNLPEAAALLDEEVAPDDAARERQARQLLALGARAVLLKGGHGSGPESVDLLADRAGLRRFSAPRHPTRHTHGTGCTLSSAIAALLARGQDLDDAVGGAKAYVSAAIAAADRLAIGSGSGPVHHFHGWWSAG